MSKTKALCVRSGRSWYLFVLYEGGYCGQNLSLSASKTMKRNKIAKDCVERIIMINKTNRLFRAHATYNRPHCCDNPPSKEGNYGGQVFTDCRIALIHTTNLRLRRQKGVDMSQRDFTNLLRICFDEKTQTSVGSYFSEFGGLGLPKPVEWLIRVTATLRSSETSPLKSYASTLPTSITQGPAQELQCVRTTKSSRNQKPEICSRKDRLGQFAGVACSGCDRQFWVVSASSSRFCERLQRVYSGR